MRFCFSPCLRGVDAVPYFLVLRDGHVVERLAGNEPKVRKACRLDAGK